MTRIARATATALPYADESVDLVVSSPPYWGLRAYQDGGYLDDQIGDEESMDDYLQRLWSVMRECWRVLVPSGVACVVIGESRAGSGGAGGDYAHTGIRAGQPKWIGTGRRGTSGKGGTPRRKSMCGVPWRFALGCVDGLADPEGTGWVLVNEVVWSKPAGMPQSVVNRFRDSHEQVFVFAKAPEFYGDAYAAASDYTGRPKRGLMARNEHAPRQRGKRGQTFGALHLEAAIDHGNGLGRIPADVLTVNPHTLTQPDFLVVEPDGTTRGLSDPVGFVPPWEGGTSGSPSMRSIMEDALVRERAGQAHAQVLAVRHYAAFPPELIEPIIRVFAPEAVCLACGEPRRRVLGRACEACGAFVKRAVRACPSCGQSTFHDLPHRTTETLVACGCDDTSAPTRRGRVLDPFVGSGTSVAVAQALGRDGLGCDLSQAYCHLATWRAQVGVDATPAVGDVVADAQASLFETATRAGGADLNHFEAADVQGDAAGPISITVRRVRP
ncbi:MAG: DNA methyltransferase [Acidimicrobiales bacterium]